MRSLKVPNKFLIFKGINLRGLWITKWIEAAERGEIEQVYGQLAQWVVDGKLTQSVEKSYKPSELAEALERSQQNQRRGKVLLDWQ